MKGKTARRVKNRQDSQESTASTQTSSSIREFELFQQFCSPDAIPSYESPLRGWSGDLHHKLSQVTPSLSETFLGPNAIVRPSETPGHDQALHSPLQIDSSRQTSSSSSFSARHKSKMIHCTILLLDGNELKLEMEKNSSGKELHERIFGSLDLVESDYFSCFTRHSDGLKVWISYDKKLSKQIENKKYHFEFAVKFYPPDPLSLQENLTKYLLCLQIQKDIYTRRLPCSFMTLALLGSYVVQSELGDHFPDVHGLGASYVHEFSFYPNQSQELVEKIAELHKSHRGLTSACADNLFLLNASKLALYGVHKQEAKDGLNNAVEVGVNSSGLVIYQDGLRINKFVWPGMLRISYKGSKFIIDVRQTINSNSSFKYKMTSFKMAQCFWQVAVEHHSFFRMKEMIPEKKRKSLLHLGQSQFKFERRTHFQTLQASSAMCRPSSNFVRLKYSISQSKSFHSSADQILSGKSRRLTPSLFSQNDIFSEARHPPMALSETYGEN